MKFAWQFDIFTPDARHEVQPINEDVGTL